MKLLLLTLGSAVLFGLVGCGGGGSDEDKFFYRMTNGVPFLANGIDFLVDKKVEAAALAYDSDTDYVETDIEKVNVFYDVKDAATGEIS